MPYHAETIVVGCGNILFKDDGFGPFVIHKLEEYFEDKEMPDEVMFIDAGTGATHFIFSLPDEYWKKQQQEHPNYNVISDNDVSTADEQKEFEIRKGDIDNFNERDIMKSLGESHIKLSDFLQF